MNWRYGFTFSLFTGMAMGILPVALKITLQDMSAVTITWYRFLVAGLVLLILWIPGRPLGQAIKLDRKTYFLLGIAILGLCGNYVFFVVGLRFIAPSTAQVAAQLAMVFLFLGGVFILGERFYLVQKVGVGLTLIGIALFINPRWSELIQISSRFAVGIGSIVFAAFCWGGYGVAQKMLSRTLEPGAILIPVFLVSAVIILPWVAPFQIFDLNRLGLIMLGVCIFISLFAYLCLAKALKCWQASRVSAVLALIPLFSVAAEKMGSIYLPSIIIAENINFLSVLGAAILISGSMITALYSGRK
jgi:drug/metabolite transporter (DMT)-like permease